MHNNLLADKLTSALSKDHATGGIKPISAEDQERIQRVAMKYQHRAYNTTTEPPTTVANFLPNAEVNAIVAVQVKIQQPEPEPQAQPEPEEEIHNPFEAYIKGIDGHILDARNRLLFTLEQAKKREQTYKGQIEKLEQDILAEQIQIEALANQLKRIDDAREGVELFAAQALEIAPLLSAVKEPPKVINDFSEVYRMNDLKEFFDANPRTSWTAGEIAAHVTAKKKESAKRNLSAYLSQLYNQGFLLRMSVGVYRKA